MTAYRFFSLKMFKLQHQFKNIVQTTQKPLINDRYQDFIVTVNVCSVHRQLKLNKPSVALISLSHCGRLPQMT